MPEDLEYFAAFFIDDEAVGEDLFEGGLGFVAGGFEEGGLEPAAVLVGAFEVHVGGVAEFGVGAFEDGVVGGAGFEPDVEDVHAFGQMRNAKCEMRKGFSVGGDGGVGVGFFCAEDLRGGVGVPGVGAVLFEVGGDLADGFFGEEDVAFVVEEGGDGDAPGALAGDAPVGAGVEHAFDAVFAPGGDPLDVVDEGFGVLPEDGRCPCGSNASMSGPFGHVVGPALSETAGFGSR